MIQLPNSVLALTAICFLAAILSTNCGSSAADEEKLTDMQSNAVLTKEDRMQAQRDSVANDQDFKSESAARILKNERTIADFKVRIMTGEVALKTRYQKRMAAAEIKNKNLKINLEQYTQNNNAQPEIFRREWEHDMSELIKSLNDMTKIK